MFFYKINGLHKAIATSCALLGLFWVGQAQAADGGVVSIGGSITEIVYALDEQDQLIARDTTSVFPPEANLLPDVGYIRALSPEGVLSTNPSLILALEGSGPPEAFDVLKKSSVQVITVPDEYNRQGIIEKIKVIGDALGVPHKAQKLADQVETDIAAAESAASTTAKKRILFVLSLRGGRVTAAGAGTSAAGIIAMAGGENALSDVHGYKQISDEAVITAAPDVILMMDRGGDHGADGNDVQAHPALAATPAAKSGMIIRMGGLYLLGFGPRTASAIQELSSALKTRAQ